MFGPLKMLFDAQLRHQAASEGFLSRLHPARTVLLTDLLRDTRDPAVVAKLGAPWLDAGRFTARVAAACVFLDGVARADGVKGWDGIPITFFQAGSALEDAREHQRRCSDRLGSFYARKFAHLLPGVHYLHVHANFSTRFHGSLKRGTLTIAPLGAFSSYDGLVYDGRRQAFQPPRRATGYRLTDYPWLLGISAAVATDYLARIVVHDLCHGFLPSTPFEAEGFHNAAALAAMGTLPPLRYRDRWESFLHAECTDPAFCLRAEAEIPGMRKALGVPSMVQEDILAHFAKWYANPNAARKRRENWGLPAGPGLSHLLAKIAEARADGFRINLRLMHDGRLTVDP